ncbi:hypothetical protein ACWDX6_28735 [Streptomyces sp. NPDC003027]
MPPADAGWAPNRSGAALHLDRPASTTTTPVDHLEADLRVRVRPAALPERIWIVGVGTPVRIPFANHLRNVVTQAHRITGPLL